MAVGVDSEELMACFPEVVCSSKKLPKVKTTAPRLKCPTGTALLYITKKEFLEMEVQGIICCSKSNWLSPIHLGGQCLVTLQ